MKVVGTQGVPVQVECLVSDGVGIHLVGLADAAVKEALLRTVTALQSYGYRIPNRKLIINVAPADLHKSGSGYDLPIALAVIAESCQDHGGLKDLDKWMVFGELGLSGAVREVPGVLQAVMTSQALGLKGCIVPEESLPAIINVIGDTLPVYPVKTLSEAVDVIRDPENALTAGQWYTDLIQKKPEIAYVDFYSSSHDTWNLIKGNEGAKRAVEIAAAGGHPLLLVGAPGSCKTLLARSLTYLLPPMDDNEVTDTAAVYSAAGNDSRHFLDAKNRPFRSPHISSSLSALLGGGAADYIRPGEVSLAHNGVLFLDEICEAPKSVMEAIRGPLEDKKITISRLKGKVDFPADFHLVAASNPCPCGYYGEGDRCTCTPSQREAYLSHLSGPLYDRLTVQAWCRQPKEGEPANAGERFGNVYARVQAAVAIQRKRYASEAYRTNEEVPSHDFDKYCKLSPSCKSLLDSIIYRIGLSVRSYTRIIRIARTIADLAGSEDILPEHISEASSYRFLDRRENA